MQTTQEMSPEQSWKAQNISNMLINNLTITKDSKIHGSQKHKSCKQSLRGEKWAHALNYSIISQFTLIYFVGLSPLMKISFLQKKINTDYLFDLCLIVCHDAKTWGKNRLFNTAMCMKETLWREQTGVRKKSGMKKNKSLLSSSQWI